MLIPFPFVRIFIGMHPSESLEEDSVGNVVCSEFLLDNSECDKTYDRRIYSCKSYFYGTRRL